MVPALATALLTLSGGDLICTEPERPRICIEIDGHPSPECRADDPIPLPADAPTFGIRILPAALIGEATRPSFTEIAPPESSSHASDGFSRAIDEPPRCA
jgi:hypothetical protein